MITPSTVRENFAQRPLWMNLLLVFCAYMTFIYVPWDFFFKPLATDKEVWFGILLSGWAAKATEPLHWAIYAAGTVGFWKMRPWMFPWASLYTAQVAIGMLVFTLSADYEYKLLMAPVAGLPFLILAVALWRAKAQFSGLPAAVDQASAE